ncbi:phosphorylase [Photobacterium sp. GJ3]|uniref:DUF4922 domain-containing protein n=1 Tax=Photobacterium sp. GJ3 TaxID=2829502 RepID=UPI001B8D300F|nr:DUF4922 domain-containing protein [Photobacterium sp. GJ3]QUJ66159.1 phosphorylase [Photobacterium sp. GJ3]
MNWKLAEQVAEKALAEGSLMPIATDAEMIEEQGVAYLGHVVTANAGKKLQGITSGAAGSNPFLPYEKSMYVCEAGEHHVCLLNKFPVITPHLLICSKTFVPQESPLSWEDWHAWLGGFTHADVLGFYNSGPLAGASQPHRHMQLVRSEIPLEQVIAGGKLPFRHWLYLVEAMTTDELYAAYTEGMHALSLIEEGGEVCLPHNVLVTERWLLILPRSANNIEGLFANGINYSGRFLVKQPDQLAWLEEYGLMRFLAECSA